MRIGIRQALAGEWFRLRRKSSFIISILVTICAGFLGAIAPRIEQKIAKIQQQVGGGGPATDSALNGFVYFASGAKGAAILTGLFISLAAAAAIAGEASSGTLRIALARPIARGKLYFAKFLALAAYLEILLLSGAAASFAGSAAVADFGPAVKIITISSTAELAIYVLFAMILCHLALFGILGFSFFVSVLSRNAAAANAVSIGFLLLCALLTFVFEFSRPWVFPNYTAAPFDTLREFALGHNAPRPTWFGIYTLQDWADITFAISLPASAALLFFSAGARIFIKKDWLS
ncbi:MAG: ABC transporter permease subunit [Planctomycetes bacterium]|nr:ABC transporter permease subunit [Planctomycetota bacterium]